MAGTLFDGANGFLPVETLIEGVALEIIAAGEPQERRQDEVGRIEPEQPLAVDLAGQLRDALDGFDAAAAHTALDRLLSAFSTEFVLTDVLIPYLRELGDRWAEGRVTVAQEHFAANLIRGRLLGLAGDWGAGGSSTTVLACLPGEAHDAVGELLAHRFAVAGGLDSMVVGERQIALQVKHAYIRAEDEGACGRVLHSLFSRALRVGKRAHSETDIDRAGGIPVVRTIQESLAGERLRYTITVKNVGTDNAVNVVLRDAVPVKCLSTSSSERPTASKICAPQYEEIVEIPIFEIAFNRPFAIAFTARACACSAVSSTRPSSASCATVASITYGFTAAAP